MKSLILLIILTLYSQVKLFACCSGHSVDIFPRNRSIATNSIFLITFSEQDYKFKDKIKSFSFQALTNQEKKITLNVVQYCFSGSQGQVLLSPNRNFTIGDSVSIIVKLSSDIDSNLSSYFKAYLENEKWFISFDADKESPKWNKDSIPSRYYNHQNSSVKGFEFTFECNVTDNYLPRLTYNIYSSTLLPMLYEITFNDEKTICPSTNLNAMIYANSCGRNFGKFNLIKNEIMSAIIRPIDSSGNFGPPKKVFFGI